MDSLPVLDHWSVGNLQGESYYDAHGDVVQDRASCDAHQDGDCYSDRFPLHGNVSAVAVNPHLGPGRACQKRGEPAPETTHTG
jgi:hypothetical protein